VYVTASVLGAFLNRAGLEGVIMKNATGGSLQDGIRQQLEESGLMGNFPKLLLAAADALSAPPYQEQITLGSLARTRPSSTSILQEANGLGSSREWLHAVLLLQSWDCMQSLCALGVSRTSIVVSTGPAALQLITSIWQLASPEVQPLQELKEAYHSDMLVALWSTVDALSSMVAAVGYSLLHDGMDTLLSQVPAAKDVLQSSQFLQGLALVQAVTVYSTAVSTRGSSQGSSSSTSNTTTSSSSTRRRDSGRVQRILGAGSSTSEVRSDCAAAAHKFSDTLRLWRQSAGMQPVLTAADYKLFSLLGVTSKPVLWIALCQSLSPSPADSQTGLPGLAAAEQIPSFVSTCLLSDMTGASLPWKRAAPIAAYHQLLSGELQLQGAAAAAAGLQPIHPMLQSQQALALHWELHLQLVGLQLRVAATALDALQGNQASGTPYTVRHAMSASCARRAVNSAVSLWSSTLRCDPTADRPTLPTQSKVNACNPPVSGPLPNSASVEQPQQQTAAALAVELLPHLLQLLSSLQKQKLPGAAVAAQTPPSGSSSSSSSNLGRSTASRNPLRSLLALSKESASSLLCAGAETELQDDVLLSVLIVCQMLQSSVLSTDSMQPPAAGSASRMPSQPPAGSVCQAGSKDLEQSSLHGCWWQQQQQLLLL